MAARLSERARVQAMLDVEADLAGTQPKLGVVPAEAAARFAKCARAEALDLRALGEGTIEAGLPVVALVRLPCHAVGEEAAPYVHLGATTQDIMDPALVLHFRAALDLRRQRLDAVIESLCRLAEEYRGTVMAGRTHGQQAVPITFGIKAAGWLAPLARHRDRPAEITPRLLVVRLGGAAGTVAALSGRGRAVMDALAEDLELAPSLAPWHAQRDTMAEFASWLSLVSGSLARWPRTWSCFSRPRSPRPPRPPTRPGAAARPCPTSATP